MAGSRMQKTGSVFSRYGERREGERGGRGLRGWALSRACRPQDPQFAAYRRHREAAMVRRVRRLPSAPRAAVPRAPAALRQGDGRRAAHLLPGGRSASVSPRPGPDPPALGPRGPSVCVWLCRYGALWERRCPAVSSAAWPCCRGVARRRAFAGVEAGHRAG